MRHLALALVLVVLGACGPDDDADDQGAEEAPPTSEEQSSPEEESQPEGDDGDAATSDPEADTEGSAIDQLDFVRCESEDIDVDYPDDWSVYEDEEVPPCRVFHPEQIDDYQNESLHYAVRLYIDPVEFEDATNSPFSEELSREEMTVDGREALVIERRSEGGGLLPEGERNYTYVVDLAEDPSGDEPGPILIGTTTTVGDTDYEFDQRVLDQMMETISIDVDGQA